MIRLLILILLCAPLFAEGIYSVERKVSLSTSAEVITLQNPAGGKRTTFEYASVYCSAAVEFTEEYDGTVSGGTTLTVNRRARDGAGTVTATHTTTIASTNVLQRHKCTAASTYVFKPQALKGGEELTIRTESATADIIIQVQWHER